MSELLTKIENNVTKYNEENNEGLMVEIKADIDKLNDEITAERYEAIIATKEPFFEALKAPFFNVKKISFKEVKAGQLIKKEAKIDDAERVVNLMDLEDHFLAAKDTKGQLSVNGQWRFRIEKVSKTFSLRIAQKLEATTDEIEKHFKLSEGGNRIELPKTTSNTQTEKELQFIVDGIIFEPSEKDKEKNKYKITKRDIAFIEALLTNEGKKLSVKAPRQQTMLRLITKALHRIVTDGSYTVE